MTLTSSLEENFAWQLNVLNLKGWVREYRWHPSRRFRFDFAWPEQKVAVEIEGGIWNGGKHGRGSGILKDCEKRSLAAVEGWLVLSVAPNHVKSGIAITWLQTVLERTHKPDYARIMAQRPPVNPCG